MEISKIDKIRHTTAHLLAQAVKEKYPSSKIAIGPTTSDGFYYDFDDISINDEDLKTLEKEMKKIASQNLTMQYEEWEITKAKKYFQEKNETYKIELIEKISKEDTKAGIVHTDAQFTDLCSGGHVENTKEINTKAFYLERTSGAYWLGDENNKMLTRIYGVAFETEEELIQYKKNKEEAKKRDHRILGKELDLFAFFTRKACRCQPATASRSSTLRYWSSRLA